MSHITLAGSAVGGETSLPGVVEIEASPALALGTTPRRLISMPSCSTLVCRTLEVARVSARGLQRFEAPREEGTPRLRTTLLAVLVLAIMMKRCNG